MRPAVNKVSAAQLRDELGARFSAPLMSFFLRRLKDRSQAEDLTQEVLLRVIRACGGDAIENADSYVFRRRSICSRTKHGGHCGAARPASCRSRKR